MLFRLRSLNNQGSLWCRRWQLDEKFTATALPDNPGLRDAANDDNKELWLLQLPLDVRMDVECCLLLDPSFVALC